MRAEACRNRSEVFCFCIAQDDDPSNLSGTFLLYRKHSWREVRVNGNVCIEEHNFCFQCEKGTTARVLFCVEEVSKPV